MAISEAVQAAVYLVERQWPAILVTVLGLVAARLFQLFRKQDFLSHIPWVGSEFGDESKRRAAFISRAQDLYEQGYRKFKQSVFQVTTTGASRVVVIGPKFLPELRNLPDDVLSFAGAIVETMHPKWTGVNAERQIVPHVVKRDLTPALNRLNPIIAEEVDLAFREEFPNCEDFTKVNLNQQLLRVVAKVSGRIFIGPELCRTEEYVDMGINYTIELMQAALAISALDVKDRDRLANSLPEVKSLHERQRKSRVWVQLLIEARQKAQKEDPDFQKPDDMVQWVLDDGQSKYGKQSIEELTEIQLGLTFAAIHTTTLSATNAFYTLAATPEVIPELRDEIRAVLKEYGTFTAHALQNMKKLDSFLREVMRTNPLSMSSFNRKVLKPFRLSDGQLIPAGCIIEVPAHQIMNDPEFYEAPERFDPWRSYRSREQEGLEGIEKAGAGAANQMVSVNLTSLNFGYGRHACPGRFFAANEIKMIVGRAVLDYDIKMADGSTKRPSNIIRGSNMIPDTSKELMFKRVAV